VHSASVRAHASRRVRVIERLPPTAPVARGTNGTLREPVHNDESPVSAKKRSVSARSRNRRPVPGHGPRVAPFATMSLPPLLHRVASTALLCTLALTGCAAEATQFAARDTTPQVQVQGPYVATGTRFAIRITRAVDLSGRVQEQPFEGAIEHALTTPGGRTLVAGGAIVRGTLIVSPRTGRFVLRDATVATSVGPIAIRARVRATPTGAVESASTTVRDESIDRSAHDTSGAHAATNSPDATESAATLGRDTSVAAVLVQPLLAPGSRVMVVR